MYYKKHIDIYELIVYDIWYMILAIIVNYVKVFQNHMKSAGLQKSILKNSAWLFFKDFPFSNAVFCIFFVLDSYTVREPLESSRCHVLLQFSLLESPIGTTV